MSRAQERFVEHWIDIVLTLVSIIQGLAFSDLAVRLPDIYRYTLSNGDFVLITHFFLSFVILLRILQTYVVAALDYDQWSVSFLDLLLIFVIGFVEYFAFSSLVVQEFDVITFHKRISIISILGIFGYVGAVLRIKKEHFSSDKKYWDEIRLQMINIIGVVSVQLISTYIVCKPGQPPTQYVILAIIATLILICNIFYSIRSTFAPVTSNSSMKKNIDILIKPAERKDALAVAQLMMQDYSYIYTSIFDTSQRVAHLILRRILLNNWGKHLLGYRSFHLAFDINSGDCIGLVLFLSDSSIRPLDTILGFSRSMLTVLRYVGIVGFIRTVRNLKVFYRGLFQIAPSEFHILYLSVQHDRQRQGVGTKLITYAKGMAKIQGKSCITLDVRETNRGAQDFFLSQGFIKEARLDSDFDSALGKGGRIRMKLTL